MVHFYSIAIYRLKDYAAAGVPVWPVRHGVGATKRQMLFFSLLFIAASPLLTIFGYAGLLSATGLLLLGIRWFWLSFAGWRTADAAMWARQMFRFSLVALLAMSSLIALGPLLP